jgi:protein TonB
VLTAEPEASDDADDTIVTGDADSYPGGWTSALGESMAAAYGPNARVGGAPGGTGSGVTVLRTPDRSHAAGLSSDTMWDCGFPWEAERDHITSSAVWIAATVRPDGSIESVEVVSDPGHGFARVVKSCALKQHLSPALDRNGHPTQATTEPFRVNFVTH